VLDFNINLVLLQVIKNNLDVIGELIDVNLLLLHIFLKG